MLLRAALATSVAGLVAATASAAAPPRVDDCVPAQERASAVRFRAPDGVRLVGVLLGRGRTGVALGHESNANLCTWLPFARTLASKGYAVLAFDHRGHGESELYPKAFYRLDRDFLGAVGQLRARGSTRFILMGASMGGTAALGLGVRRCHARVRRGLGTRGQPARDPADECTRDRAVALPQLSDARARLRAEVRRLSRAAQDA